MAKIISIVSHEVAWKLVDVFALIQAKIRFCFEMAQSKQEFRILVTVFYFD